MREWEEEARGGEGEGKREERVGRKGVRGGEEGGKRRGGKRQEVREGGGKGREKGVGEEETGEWRKMEDEEHKEVRRAQKEREHMTQIPSQML